MFHADHKWCCTLPRSSYRSPSWRPPRHGGDRETRDMPPLCESISNVVRLTPRKEVIRIYAVAHIAAMTNLKSGQGRAHEQLIGDAVRESGVLSVAELPIPAPRNAPPPQPTSCRLFNLLKESFCRGPPCVKTAPRAINARPPDNIPPICNESLHARRACFRNLFSPFWLHGLYLETAASKAQRTHQGLGCPRGGSPSMVHVQRKTALRAASRAKMYRANCPSVECSGQCWAWCSMSGGRVTASAPPARRLSPVCAGPDRPHGPYRTPNRENGRPRPPRRSTGRRSPQARYTSGAHTLGGSSSVSQVRLQTLGTSGTSAAWARIVRAMSTTPSTSSS